ncbi:MAG: hypothetical protein P8Y36_02875, partial [Alphaproteobacteria bacterium]
VYTFCVQKRRTRTRLKPANNYTQNRDGTRAKTSQKQIPRFYATDDEKNSAHISRLARWVNIA